jgi:hypothetical protein
MQRWEYTSVELATHSLTEGLNRLGQEGWEAIGLSSPGGGIEHSFVVILKRPKA